MFGMPRTKRCTFRGRLLHDCDKILFFYADGPKDVSIETQSAAVGYVLKCTSVANPEVDEDGYSWNISGTLHNGSTVIVPEKRANLKDAKCCAENEVRGIKYQACAWIHFDVLSK